MKSFAIQEEKKKKRYYSIRTLSVVFAIILMIIFAIISFFAKVNNWTQYKSKIDIFNQDMDEIAFYFWTIDKNVANMLLGIDEISKAYLDGENILKSKSKQLDNTLYYIKENKSYLQSLGFKKYEYLIDILSDIWIYKDEVKQLLGSEQPQNYLVILQNTNERRPNGGFFGSFAFVTLDQARITNLEIIDAYYPDYFAPGARISIPYWAKEVFPGADNIGFIAGNKYGFTDKDGKNIKDLYEMSFNTHYNEEKLSNLIDPSLHEKLLHKYIKGVIFVRLDLFTRYFPQLENKSKEWQFVNANIDLIRGTAENDKKEKYIQEVNLFYENNRQQLFKSIINNAEEIVDQRGINIYLSNVNTGIENILERRKLTTVFNTGYIYLWDTNIAHNKSDAFIEKNVEIYDDSGSLVGITNNNILDVHSLESGRYTIKIYYSFNIQPAYIKHMHMLEEKYNIQMTEREQSILSLMPSLYISTDGIPRYRGTQARVYTPKHIDVLDIRNDALEVKNVSVPFANVGMYKTYITKDNQTKIVEIKIHIP